MRSKKFIYQLLALFVIASMLVSACLPSGDNAEAIESAAQESAATAQAPSAETQADIKATCDANPGMGTVVLGGKTYACPVGEQTAFEASDAVDVSGCGSAYVVDTQFQGTAQKPLYNDGNAADQWAYVIFHAEDLNGVAKSFWGFVEIKYYADIMIQKFALTNYYVKANNREDAICVAENMTNEKIVYFGNNTPSGMTTKPPSGWNTTVKPYPTEENIWAGNGNYSSFDILTAGAHTFTCAVLDYCYTQEWWPNNEGEAWHTLIWPGYQLITPAMQGHGGIFANPPLSEGADPLGNFMQDSERKVVLDSITTLHRLFCGPTDKVPSGWTGTMPDGFTCKKVQ